MVVIVEETPLFYVVQAHAYEIDDGGARTPLSSRTITYGKTEFDGFEGALQALRTLL